MIALEGSKEAYRWRLQFLDAANPEHAEARANSAFILDHFHEIDHDTAFRMNPNRVMQNVNNHFYFCDVYDQAAASCSDWEHRPPVCKGFPWYGVDPQDRIMLGGLTAFPRCGFWWDIPREQWPAHITEETVLPPWAPDNRPRPTNCC